LAPDVVIVQFGLNDAAVDLHLGKDHPRVPLAEFRRSMETVVDKLQARGARVVLMTPNPVIWTPGILAKVGRFPYRPDERWGYNVFVSDYAESVRELALRRGVALVDVYKILKEFDETPGHRLEELTHDGVHPNAKGQELIAQSLLPVLISTAGDGN
jgi:lysophospholipase L1-like esterase